MDMSGIDMFHFHNPWPLRRPEGTAFEDTPPTPFHGIYCPNSKGYCRTGCCAGDAVAGWKMRGSYASSIPLYPATTHDAPYHGKYHPCHVLGGLSPLVH